MEQRLDTNTIHSVWTSSVWTGVLVASEALMIVVLVIALLYGQPAALANDHVKTNVQATTISVLQATVTAMPTPQTTCFKYTYQMC